MSLPEHHEIDGRLSKLEAIVEALAGNLSRVTEDIGRLAEYSRASSSTNWGTVFAGITLVVVLVTGYVGLPLNALEKNFEQHVNKQREEGTLAYTERQALAAAVGETIGELKHRLRGLETNAASDAERVHALEREIYAGTSYRSGRPVPHPHDTVLHQHNTEPRLSK